MTPSPPYARLDPDLDRRLVERCLEGDARAWEQLVRRHERLVHAVARSWRLDEADLGDVVQEVFAALVQGLPRLREARALVRWLASTTERVARAAALRARRAAALAPATDPATLQEVALDAPDALEDLERLERQALIRLALAAIGERCRALLSALYYEDPTPAYAELARRMGMPIGSLGPTRARCFQRMRDTLERLTAADESGITRPARPTSDDEGSTSEPLRRPREPRGARRDGMGGDA